MNKLSCDVCGNGGQSALDAIGRGSLAIHKVVFLKETHNVCSICLEDWQQKWQSKKLHYKILEDFMSVVDNVRENKSQVDEKRIEFRRKLNELKVEDGFCRREARRLQEALKKEAIENGIDWNERQAIIDDVDGNGIIPDHLLTPSELADLGPNKNKINEARRMIAQLRSSGLTMKQIMGE